VKAIKAARAQFKKQLIGRVHVMSD